MILLADENIDRTVIAQLRLAGHEVLAVAEMDPGIDDSTVLAIANERQALLVTEDKDFGELIFRQRLINTGVILVRLAGMSATAKSELIVHTLAEHGGEMSNAFTALRPGVLRIRRQTA